MEEDESVKMDPEKARNKKTNRGKKKMINRVGNSRSNMADGADFLYVNKVKEHIYIYRERERKRGGKRVT